LISECGRMAVWSNKTSCSLSILNICILKSMS